MPYIKKDADISNPLKAIQVFCFECCGGEKQDVKECTAKACALYPYRLGKNPYRKSREYTEEEKEKLKERAKKASAGEWINFICCKVLKKYFLILTKL